MFGILLLFQLGTVVASSSPCSDYTKITTNGFRSSDFNSFDSDILICDDDMLKDEWYRFDLDAGIQLIERYVEPFYCGTQAPIWMNGSHPTDYQQVLRTVCATYSHDNRCGWNGTVTIQLCNQTGETFYIYKLAIPDGCSLAYCIDAATRKQCQLPQVWLPDEYQCGKNSTPPPSTTRRTTTPMPTIPPGSTGWGEWGPWSGCSKPCDYGTRTRKRFCLELPCQGSATENEVCNEYNCEVLREEQYYGIVLDYSSQDDDTMLKVVLNEEKVNDLIQKSLNEICTANASACCGTVVKNHLPDGIAFVTSDDVYTSQGYPRPRSNGHVILKVVAVISDFIYGGLCQSTKKRRSVKRDTGRHYVSYEIMKAAVTDCEDQIEKDTGLSLTYGRAENYPIGDGATSSDDCSALCIALISVGCVVAVGLILIVSVICCKCLNKNSCKIDSPPPYEGPGPDASTFQMTISPDTDKKP